MLLLSNDDGYLAQGVRALAEVLSANGEMVRVVAPDRNCSGVSHCLTLNRPLSVHEHGNQWFSVDGTPADCVNLAVSGLFEDLPEMVISGINRGANLGDDVFYSGTVAAAFEGWRAGYFAMAVSNVSNNPQYYADSAQVVVRLLALLRQQPLPQSMFLNVNIPDMPLTDIRGVKITVCGRRGKSLAPMKVVNPRGGQFVWVGASSGAVEYGEGTDFQAVDEGFVSVTPLRFDLTNNDALASMNDWIKDFRL